VTAVVTQYSYTLNIANGASAIANYPMSIANPVTTSYTFMRSTTLMSPEGLSVEVPKGLRSLEIMLAQNSYGSTSGTQLLTGSALQDWGIILYFELYDPIPNDYTYER
jgi:hypothetical protein